MKVKLVSALVVGGVAAVVVGASMMGLPQALVAFGVLALIIALNMDVAR